MPTQRKRQASCKGLRKKVIALRERLRAQGLRPIQIWVPDVRAPSLKEEAGRQSRLAANSPHASDDQAFIDCISATKF